MTGPRGPGRNHAALPDSPAPSASYLEADDKADGTLLAFFTDTGTTVLDTVTDHGHRRDRDAAGLAVCSRELERALAGPECRCGTPG